MAYSYIRLEKQRNKGNATTHLQSHPIPKLLHVHSGIRRADENTTLYCALYASDFATNFQTYVVSVWSSGHKIRTCVAFGISTHI